LEIGGSKDHVGVSDHLELLKLMDLVKELIVSMDDVRQLYYTVIGLVTWQDTWTTSIFLTMATLIILHYEVVVPFLMLVAASWLLSNKYYHKRFKSSKANNHQNIKFIAVGANLVIDQKASMDRLQGDVFYWGKPDQTVMLTNLLVAGSFGSFFVL
jgi:hypothetical protein